MSIESASAAPRAAPRWLEWSVSILSAWLVVGVYLDGWAHIRGLPESFFSPWHGVIYSGFALLAAVLFLTAVRGRSRGGSWRRALPDGYGLSMIGVGLFAVAGVADLVWHSVFGIEADIEALYSPPHLLLAVGGALIITGPLRAAWKATHASRGAIWRAIVAQTLLLAMFTFFSAESHPFVHPWAWAQFEPRALGPAALDLPPMPEGGVGPRELAQTLGVSSVLIQGGILVGLTLLLIRRWGAGLPIGWMTFVLSLNAVGASIFHATPWTIPVGVLAGLVCDVIYRWLAPSLASCGRLRLFAGAVPTILYGLYFGALFLLGGVWWAPPLWLGAIVIAGLGGWLLSYLVVPPASPEDAPGLRLRLEARS